VDEARPPRREARFSGCPGTVMRVCVEASPVQRDRRSCLCSLRRTVSRWRSSGGCRVCIGLYFRCDTALVTTAQAAAAFFDLLSQLVGDGGVLLWVCLFCSGFVRVVASLRLVMYNCFFFLNDRAVLLLSFQKKALELYFPLQHGS
jgi:hypothetical protein